ncbi:MAG TPA: pyrroloquinoline quinone precursor peptide PqqA [Alphaproteobacteria bacterium]|nr:pyrroloquinoline quinone precursor peptide PqqA [Alphaproteobacteria bacterium]
MVERRLPIRTAGKDIAMWKKPKVVEIAVGMEINSYACAEIA